MKLNCYPPKRDHHYMMEIIAQKDGSKSPAFTTTPIGLLAWLDKVHEEAEENPEAFDLKENEHYVNFLMDVGHVREVSENKEESNGTDLIMQVPMFSIKAFRLIFQSEQEGDENGS